MPYEVVWTRRAQKSLSSLDKITISRIIKKVEEIKDSPHLFLERLVSFKAWKLRVGDYRVFIELDEKGRKLYVLELGHRKKVYK
jgi:mRNA interferase RelE/StbE